jgi:hypothetical protein
MNTNYTIDTKALLLRHKNNVDAAVNELITQALNGKITFPYKRQFSKPAEELFANLKIVQITVSKGTPFKLFSYFPRYNSYLPPLFRNTPTVIASTEQNYQMVDVLSDLFLEEVRLQAKRFDQSLSVFDAWRDSTQLSAIMRAALKQPIITPVVLREVIYQEIAETKAFNPSWAKALLEVVVGPELRGKKWLDISAGLGDRLLAAMALDMDYVGYDPNVLLQSGHTEMIKRFGNTSRHQVIYQPFETAIIPPGPYDVSLVSPPFFTIEEYVVGQPGQSIVNYPGYEQWMVWFLFASLSKVWDNLKVDGYLILHLGDNKEVVTSEAANIFIENYLPGASWEGVIGVQGEAGRARPVWVWKKLAPGIKRVLWEPARPSGGTAGPLMSKDRSLFLMYPLLHQELLRFYANKYAPNYMVRHNNAKIIREHVASSQLQDDLAITAVLSHLGTDETIAQLTAGESLITLAIRAPYYAQWLNNAGIVRDQVATRVPNVNKMFINDILSDNAMLISLLETLQLEGTITWGVAMVRLAYK